MANFDWKIQTTFSTPFTNIYVADGESETTNDSENHPISWWEIAFDEAALNPTTIPPITDRHSVWTRKDGTKVAVKDMDDHHLKSTIYMLVGESPEGTVFHTSQLRRERWFKVLMAEAEKRGLLL